MRAIFLILLLLSTSVKLISQEIDFETYSVQDGLARSGVYSLMQDDNGLIVIGTEGGGVCFFDGEKFRTLDKGDGLIDNNIRRVFQDSEGGYWFGTPKGVTYMGRSGVTSLTEEDGLEDNFVRYIAEDDKKQIWIATNNGVSVLDLESFKLEKQSKFNFSLPHRKVRTIMFDGKNMWFGTDAGLCRLNKDNQLKIFTTLEGLSSNRILCLEKGRNDEVFIGTSAGFNIIKDEKVIEKYDQTNGLLNDRIRAIAEQDNGAIFIGTRDGLAILSRRNGSIITLTEKNGLSNDRIRNLLIDNQRNVWVGTYFGGIMKYSPGDFFSISKFSGLSSNVVLNIFEDEKGDVIIGTINGVNKLKFKNRLISDIIQIGEEDGLIFPEVNHVIKDSKGYYWYSTSSGISIFEENSHYYNITDQDNLIDIDVSLIKEIKPNEFWIGTVDGLSILRVKSRNPFKFDIESYNRQNGLSGRTVSFIEEDENGNVWIGYKEGNIDIFQNDRIMKPKNAGDLGEINSGFFDSKNNIWVGTEGGGLFKLRYDQKSSALDYTQFSLKDGLISDFIYSITESKNNNLWIGTEKGVSKIVFDEKENIKYVRNYNEQEGFKAMECNVNSILCDQKGNIWFGTVRGIQYLLKNNEDGVKEEAKIKITQVESNGGNYDWFDFARKNGYFEPPSDLRIPYKNNYIGIRFKGLFLSSPEKIEYSWKLKRHDEWTPFSLNDYIHFTNLEPGTYTIQVKSKTPEDVISAEPVEFTFVVIEPFYKNIWFRVFMGLVLIGLGYLIYLWRVRNLKKQKLALEKVVEERTEEISNQNEQLSEKNREITDSINYAKRIQDTIIPSEERVRALLGNNSFVLFKPKDIVSGDFYWVREIDKDTKIFCVADCTGHGVPGAMVSLVGANALNKAVGEFNLTKPSEILNQVNAILIEAFSNEGKAVADGMDIAICKITKKDGKVYLEYSGGNNALWVFNPKRTTFPEIASEIRDNDDELVGFALKPDKFGVGKNSENLKFTNLEIELLNDDEVVIFTDGYADQFGGAIESKPMGKKFKYSRMKLLLAEIHHENLDYQKEILDKTLGEWMGDLEQVDDVCVLALKI